MLSWSLRDYAVLPQTTASGERAFNSLFSGVTWVVETALANITRATMNQFVWTALHHVHNEGRVSDDDGC